MSIGKFFFPPLLLFLSTWTCLAADSSLKPPYTVMYPRELTNEGDLVAYFQYSSAPMAYINVNCPKKPCSFSAGNDTNLVDLGSVIYRTHAKKGVWFRFSSGSIRNDNVAELKALLKGSDVSSNIIGLPIVSGPSGNEPPIKASLLLDDPEFMFKASISLGFEEGSKSNQYTAKNMDDLATAAAPYCTNHTTLTRTYIALKASFLANSEQSVLENFKFTEKFAGCHLLLYSMPGDMAIKMEPLQSHIIAYTPYALTEVFTPGRSTAYRIYSAHYIAWGYAIGHDLTDPQYGLFKGGLHQVLSSRAKTLRLPVFASDWDLRSQAFLFKPYTYPEMEAIDFEGDFVDYLAQVLDPSRIALLRLDKYQYILELIKVFRPKNYPFYECQLLNGPNAQMNVEADRKALETAMGKKEAQDVSAKFVFSFYERLGEEPTYTKEHMDALVAYCKEGWVKSRPFGVRLDLAYWNKDFNLTDLLILKNFKWLFLSYDSHNPDLETVQDERLLDAAQWLPQFKEKIVFLLMNVGDAAVNKLYQLLKVKLPPPPSLPPVWNHTTYPTEPPPTVIPTTPIPSDPGTVTPIYEPKSARAAPPVTGGFLVYGAVSLILLTVKF